MKKILGILVLLLSLSYVAEARILRVNNTPNIAADYNSLENALLDISEGDTIYLEPSSQPYGERDAYGYKELLINKKINIIGPGYYLAENKITDFAAGESFIGGLVRFTANDINVSGVIFAQIKIEANNVTLNKCQVLAGANNAIKINEKIDGAVIQQCFVVGDIKGINYPQNVMISNNIICGDVEGLERSRIEHNTFGKYYSYGTAKDLRFSTVIENIFENLNEKKATTTSFLNNFVGDYSLFMNKNDFTVDRFYKIKLGSQLSTKGEDGGPIGAFGGEMPYVISGLPDFPVISNVTGPTSVNSNQGLQVTVSYKIDR